MLRLLVFLGIVSTCSVAIPYVYQSNPEVFHRNLNAGAERVRKLITGKEKASDHTPIWCELAPAHYAQAAA